MSKKKLKQSKPVIKIGLRISKIILFKLLELGEMYVGVFANPTGFIHEQKMKTMPPSYYQRATRRLAAQGWIKESQKQGKKFIKLTKKGRLHALLYKLHTKQTDKKRGSGWQLVIFDIPEVAKRERHALRSFLKAINFHQLQKSVYISPDNISIEAVDYLRESGLIRYVRFLHVDRLDDEKHLCRIFGIKERDMQ